MITDAQFVQLRSDQRYFRCYSHGFDGLVRDVISTETDDFKQDIAFGIKLLKRFAKQRLIRKELARATQALIEAALSTEAQWPWNSSAVEAKIPKVKQQTKLETSRKF